MQNSVLIAVSGESLQKHLVEAFKREKTTCQPWNQSSSWMEMLGSDVGLVIIDEQFLDNTRVLRELRSRPKPPSVVVLVMESDPTKQARLIVDGAEAVLSSRLPEQEIIKAILAILARLRETAARAESPAEGWRPRLSDFSSASPAMQSFMQVVKRVVNTQVPLLVLGETGVGKEWLSRAIHNESSRAAGPFVAVNCGALPEGLLESELFGHEKGAFTGAAGLRRGHFEMAHDGMLFLDEIGEMPMHTQVKLLRVLQDHEIQRVGGEKSLRVDVRVIAATNRDLLMEVEAGRFRRDLYYRLGVLTLSVPPLRERREDIPALIDTYIKHFRPHVNGGIVGVSDESVAALVRYDWPGNVRELINVIERAMILCSTGIIEIADLPVAIGHRPVILPSKETRPGEPYLMLEEQLFNKRLPDARRGIIEQFERIYLTRLLESTGGRINETARRAGIRPRSLYDRMQLLGINKEKYQAVRNSIKPEKESANPSG